MKFDNIPNSRIKVATFFINQIFCLIHRLPYIVSAKKVEPHPFNFIDQVFY